MTLHVKLALKFLRQGAQISLDDYLLPYQLPFPEEALDEIVIPYALTTDEREWVPQTENVWFRPLCPRRSQGHWVTLL